MRSITAKLLISIGIIILLFSILLLYYSYSLADKRINRIIGQQASMALKFNLAIRSYIGSHVRPVMYDLVGEDEFIPETMSTSYVSRSIFENVKKEFPDYIIKFSSTNPRNPINKAGEEEIEIINYFNRNPNLNKWEGMITINDKIYLAKFNARRMKKSCLRCHGNPEDAPASLLKRYGSEAGFHLPMGEVIGMDTVAIPLTKISEKLWAELKQTYFLSLAGLILCFGAVIIAVKLLIINRLIHISKHFLAAVDKSDYSQIQPVRINGKDEIYDLASGFNRLAEKLKNFYASLDNKVKEKTKSLEESNASLLKEIEERKATEKALKESEDRFKSLQAASFGGVIIHDKGLILDCNKGLSDITGFTYKELVGMDGRKLIAPDWVDRVMENIKTGYGKRYKVEGVRKDGSIYPLSIKGKNIHYKGREARVIEFRDITNVKEALEAVEKSEKRYRELFEQSPIGFALLRMNGQFVSVNPAFADITGYGIDSLLKISYLDITPASYLEENEKIREQLDLTGRYGPYEKEYIHKDGHIVPVKVNSMIVTRDDEKYIWSSVEDITALKKAEKEKEDLTEKLQQAYKMEAVGTMAGGIAHDFNNILFPIIGYTEMLLEDAEKGSNTFSNLEGIYTSAIRARDLVKQILTFSRQETSEIQLVRLQTIIKEVLKLLRSTIPTTIGIKHNLEENCGPVNADLTQIHQVIMNLTTNAYHAMKKTGGDITITLKEVKLSETDLKNTDMRPGDYARLTIADKGIGIDKDIMNKIFDPFFTTKEKGQGTGMGLSVVHGIVQSMKGAIQVYSEPDQGTEFKLYLPVEKSDSVLHLVREKSGIKGGSEHIMLVDDEDSIIMMEERLLSSLGYKVTSFKSSIDALAFFKEKHKEIDLVITDMAMPELPGDKLSEKLIKINPDLPILLCTGFSDNMSEDQAKKLGIQGFLMKPVIMEDLTEKIREVLS